MTIEDFNTLVEQAYEAAFVYEQHLTDVYESAYARQTTLAASRFETITASWTPPIYESLSTGMSEQEVEEADTIRDDAAYAILAVFAAAGITASSREFMEAISQRAQLNFEQEILRQLRKVVQQSFDAGMSAEATAAAIRDQVPQIIPSSAQMLAQTELTSLVNERSMAAAQKQFPDGISKTWLTVGDNRVRAAHAAAAGQTVPIDQPFQIGGSSLMYPGDPSGPLRLVARCRCRLSYTDPTAVTAGGNASLLEDTMETMEPLTTNNQITWIGNVGSWQWQLASGTVLDPGMYFYPYPDSLTSGVTITVSDDGEVAEAEADPMEDGPAWRALLAVEGVETEDGRLLAEGSLTWRALPLTLTAMDTSNHGAEGEAKVAGRIDRIWRDGNEVWGEGVFNTDEFGTHIYELVSNQSLRGNSIEPAVLAYEIRNRETGEVLEGEAVYEAMMDDVPLLTVFLEAVIMASTIVATPAIADANIILASGLLRTSWFQEQDHFRGLFIDDLLSVMLEPLTASAAGMAPLHPPSAWFSNPKFGRLTGLIVTDEGRVMGHAAGWNSCHIGEPRGPGICVPPPRSGMSYEVFHHGLIRTEEGEDIPCGPITMSALHATDEKTWKTAREHYEHSGCVVADVVAGEDRFGIWVSGALRPDISAERVREFKAGALSGDWRDVIGRGLEFLGALVVNIPGFPIPRPRAVVVASANGEEKVLALTAAGIVAPEPEVEGMSRREYLRKIRVLTQ